MKPMNRSDAKQESVTRQGWFIEEVTFTYSNVSHD